jgi:hypothetical protein
MNLTIPGIYLSIIMLFSCAGNQMDKIDRHALVNRHNIVVEKFDTLASLSAGNGNFAFTTDFTGLQTFFREYENGVSLGTQSNWGWHTLPNTGNYEIQETWNHYEVEGRQVPYRDQLRTSTRATEAVNYFRENPHRLHLGLIRLLIYKENGEEVNYRRHPTTPSQAGFMEGRYLQ